MTDIVNLIRNNFIKIYSKEIVLNENIIDSNIIIRPFNRNVIHIYNKENIELDNYGRIRNQYTLKKSEYEIDSDLTSLNLYDYTVKIYPFFNYYSREQYINFSNMYSFINIHPYIDSNLNMRYINIFIKLEKENDKYYVCFYFNKRILENVNNGRRDFKLNILKTFLYKIKHDELQSENEIYLNKILNNTNLYNDLYSDNCILKEKERILKDNVKLYEYQKNDILWMRKIEQDILDGNNIIKNEYKGNFLLSFGEDISFLIIPEYDQIVSVNDKLNNLAKDNNLYNTYENIFEYYGGNLISEMGLGKSLILLYHLFSKENNLSIYDNFVEISPLCSNTNLECNYFYKRGKLKGKKCEKKIKKTPNSLYCREHSDTPFIDKKALIYKNLTNFNINDILISIDGKIKFKTNSSLIICPNQLCDQWVREYYDKFNDNNLNKRILMVVTMDQFNNLTFGDILFSDLIIISYSFLSNNQYKYYCNLNHFSVFSLPNENDDNYLLNNIIDVYEESCKWVSDPLTLLNSNKFKSFNNFYFNSINLDEFHEILNMPKRCQLNNTLSSLSSLFKWNISGTPFPNGVKSFVNCFTYNTSLKNYSTFDYKINKDLIEKSFKLFKRNTKESIKNEYSKNVIIENIKLLEFTSYERSIYDSYNYGNSKKYYDFLIKLCCDPEIHSETKELINNCKTFKEIQDVLLEHNKQKLEELNKLIQKLKRNISFAEDELEVLKEELDVIETVDLTRQNEMETLKLELSNLRRKLTNENKNYDNVNRTYTYLQNAINNLKNVEMCLICLDDILEDNISITKCGHKFCADCIQEYIEEREDYNLKCPKCNLIMNKKDIYYLKKEDSLETVQDLEESNELLEIINKVKSTKLGNVIHYINNELKNDDKCIIFSQHSELLKKLEKYLEKNVVFCNGTVYQRKKSIDKFKNNSNYQIIMLSSENAASGINLTVANKIILIEPVYGDIQYRKDIESQAIGRADRLGRDKNSPIEIIRFIIKDTIEEEILKSGYNLDNKKIIVEV